MGHFLRGGVTLRSAADFTGGNIVEDKINPPFWSFIHDTVFFLVIDLIHFPDRHFLRPAVDHKTDPWVSHDWDMNTVPVMK